MGKRVVVGTAGHIDHGKSALVRALTGTDPDRLKEEKERGITIELGFAHLALPSGTLAGIVDVPGHEKFVRTMVAGAAGIDIVMLVVAADEGVMPQTREHLDICRLLAVRDGLVVLNKCDKADPEWCALQEEEIRTFVRGTFLEGAPVVRVSAVTGEGLPALVAALDRIAARVPGKDSSLLFRLPVDRSFTMKGFGTVVTGTIVGGAVRAGDLVRILPGGTEARVRGIQIHGGPADGAFAGTRTAVNLQGVEKESAPRGSVLVHPGTVGPTRSVEALVEYLPLARRPLRNRARVSFHAFTASGIGKVHLYGTPEVAAGGSAYARIDLEDEFVLTGGDRFILRGFSPLENFGYTIGGGRVLSPRPPARKGAAREVPGTLPRLASPDGSLRLLAAAEDAGAGGLSLPEAAAAAGIGPGVAREAIDAHRAAGLLKAGPDGARFWHAGALAAAGRSCLASLEALHKRFPDREGFPAEEISQVLPEPRDPAFAALVLSSLGEMERDGDLFFLPSRRPRAVELSSPLARAIAARVLGAGLAAPSKAEILEAVRDKDGAQFEKTLDGLVRGGRILRVKELYFDPAAVEALREKLVAWLAERREISVPEFKELSGLSRKYVIPLLEHFDLAKVTLRVGDKRILRKGK